MAKKKSFKETRGRKSLPDHERSIQVTFYVKKTYVESHGGLDNCRAISKAILACEAETVKNMFPCLDIFKNIHAQAE